MSEAEKLAAMTTDARIVEAIKSTDYKYFGDYEMSDGQRDAVDVLVVAARELMKLRTDHDAALRRAKAEVWGEVIEGATSLRASVENGIPPHERVGFMRACNEIIGYARAAQIEGEEKQS